MDQPCLLDPDRLPASRQNGIAVGFAVAGQRIAFGRDHDAGRQSGEIRIVQRCVAWIILWRLPTGADLLIEFHIRDRQLGRIGVADIAALRPVPAKPRIDQYLPPDAPVNAATGMMGDSGS